MGEVFRWWRVCVEVTQKRQEMENHVIFSQQTKDKNSKDEVGVEIKTFDWKFVCIKAIGWGHFRVAPRLCFEARLYVKPMVTKMCFMLAQKKPIFSRKVFSLGLQLCTVCVQRISKPVPGPLLSCTGANLGGGCRGCVNPLRWPAAF